MSHARVRPSQVEVLESRQLLANPVQPTERQAWVAQYNGDYSYWEEVADVALGNNSVYVTGFEYTDVVTSTFATVKYDYAGRQLWARNYGFGGVNGSAQAKAIAVDGAGNAVVVGWSYDYEPGPPETIFADAAILKYDTNGNVVWERRYRLPGMNNQPQDVVIDSAGNAYVTGAAWVNGGFDVMLVKYSPEGELLWDRTIGRSGDRWDAGYAVALDPDENPVIAGYTQPFAFDPNRITWGHLVKFSADGNLLWQRDHVSYTNASAWWHVAINDAGQIYTAGEIAPPGDLHHLWTSQYESNGTLAWDRDYDGSANDSNYIGGLALTPTGGVVVSGTSSDIDDQGGVTNIVTIRYQPDGTQAWQRLDRGGYAQALGRDIAVDSSGRAYVTGYAFNDNGLEDMVTFGYSPTGDRLWTRVYADPHGRSDRATAIAVDKSSNVFVVGDAWVGFENYYDFTTIRYSASRFAFPLEPERLTASPRSLSDELQILLEEQQL